MMRFASSILSLILLAAGCGGAEKSATEFCKEAAQAYCDKVFDCPEGASRRAMEGSTKEACVASAQAVCPTPGQTCPGTQTYHADKAQQCASDYGTLSCSAWAAEPNLAVCDDICTAP